MPAPPDTPPPDTSTPAAAAARARLLAAGIELFGRDGFDATSTRNLARAAGVNIAGIAYHFGGKEGLYAACAEDIAARVRGHIAEAVDALPEGPDEARATMQAILSTMVRLVAAAPEMEASARFVLREHMDPTPAFEILYDSLIGPLGARLCGLFAAVTGVDRDAPETRLAMLGLIGQILMFRIARRAACRRLGWSGIGPGEARLIEAMVHRSLDALIAQQGTTS